MSVHSVYTVYIVCIVCVYSVHSVGNMAWPDYASVHSVGDEAWPDYASVCVWVIWPGLTMHSVCLHVCLIVCLLCLHAKFVTMSLFSVNNVMCAHTSH